MKEKQLYSPFNEYKRLFEFLTGCSIKCEKSIVERRLKRFLEKFNIPYKNPLIAEQKIKSSRDVKEEFLDVFIPVESYFFREGDYLNLAIELSKKNNLKNILVVPCACGETVYSLSILGEEKNHTDLQITGIDISSTAIEKAKKGIYPDYSLKNLSPLQKEKYFLKKGSAYQLKEGYKKNCNFIVSNLLTINEKARYGIIICRNFLIYLNEKSVKEVLRKLFNLMDNQGVLILSKSELPYINYWPYFKQEKQNNLIFFRKKDD